MLAAGIGLARPSWRAAFELGRRCVARVGPAGAASRPCAAPARARMRATGALGDRAANGDRRLSLGGHRRGTRRKSRRRACNGALRCVPALRCAPLPAAMTHAPLRSARRLSRRAVGVRRSHDARMVRGRANRQAVTCDVPRRPGDTRSGRPHRRRASGEDRRRGVPGRESEQPRAEHAQDGDHGDQRGGDRRDRSELRVRVAIHRADGPYGVHNAHVGNHPASLNQRVPSLTNPANPVDLAHETRCTPARSSAASRRATAAAARCKSASPATIARTISGVDAEHGLAVLCLDVLGRGLAALAPMYRRRLWLSALGDRSGREQRRRRHEQRDERELENSMDHGRLYRAP